MALLANTILRAERCTLSDWRRNPVSCGITRDKSSSLLRESLSMILRCKGVHPSRNIWD